jgi:hypothetical protein
MKREDVVEVVRETVPVAVEETFLRLGVDASDPIEMQKDMAFLRLSRTTSNKVLSKIFTMLLSAGGGGGIVAGFLHYFQ